MKVIRCIVNYIILLLLFVYKWKRNIEMIFKRDKNYCDCSVNQFFPHILHVVKIMLFLYPGITLRDLV